MQVQVIDNIQQFEQVKDTWDAVYSADPHATVFSSWAWLRGWMESSPDDWLILAVPTDAGSSYAAFMALGLPTGFKKESGSSYHHLCMAGSPFSDQTGFICLSEYVSEAIPALAYHLADRLKWDVLELRNITDPRVDPFLGCFSAMRFGIHESEFTPCPYILLPETWDQYEQEFLSPGTRKEFRNKFRKMECLDGFHITEVREDNIELHIDTLLSLWKERWGLKSDDYFMGYITRDVLAIFRSVFRHCYSSSQLWIHILWRGNTPIAGNAAFVDRQRRLFSSYLLAVNYEFAKLSPGMVMDAYKIRWAIENKYRLIDLGGGGEKYKFVFCENEKSGRNIVIRPESVITRLRSRLRLRDRLKNWGRLT